MLKLRNVSRSLMKSLPNRWSRSISPAVANVFMKFLSVEKMTSMAIALSTRETLPTEVTMDDFRGKRRLTGAIDDACGFIDDELEKWYEEYKASRKDHELHFEISIAWDDDDEFEHEGYYHSVDDAIEALLKYKK